MLKSLFLSTADPGSGEFSREELALLVGKLPRRLRGPAANYLQSPSLVIMPWMESTEDLLEGRFSVAGGSAIYSDGQYYWRLDTARYVETYGIEISSEFLHHAMSRDWQPPELKESQHLALYDELTKIMRNFARVNGRVPSVQVFYPDDWAPEDPRRDPPGK